MQEEAGDAGEIRTSDSLTFFSYERSSRSFTWDFAVPWERKAGVSQAWGKKCMSHTHNAWGLATIKGTILRRDVLVFAK